jgi:hypothetical protein
VICCRIVCGSYVYVSYLILRKSLGDRLNEILLRINKEEIAEGMGQYEKDGNSKSIGLGLVTPYGTTLTRVDHPSLFFVSNFRKKRWKKSNITIKRGR